VLFEGSQRALFSLLFGAGMLLMVTRLGEVPGARPGRTYYRRIFWLMAFGLFDAFVLLWPADILLTYALCGLLLYPLRRLSVPRSGLLTGERSRALSWALVLGGYAIGLPLAVAEARALLAGGFDPIVDRQWQVLYDLRRIGVATGHLGVILLLCRSGVAVQLRRRLAAVGRMALSNYLAQSVIGGFLFYSVGLGLYGRYTGWHLYVFVLAIWLIELTWSSWWLARFRFGPAEWLWRSLVYRRRQAMVLTGP
jgi:uncharacterized protein